MVVPCGPGGVVHDYVPLYFGALSPMLLGVINRKNVDQGEIVYLEFPIDLIDRADVVFSDASANTQEHPGFYDDPRDLRRLNWTEIDSLKWSSANDILRHQRMAEALVHRRLDVQEAARIVVWNGDIKKTLTTIARERGVRMPPVEFESPERRHYYTKFMFGEPNVSLVMGPKAVRSAYEDALDAVRAASPPTRPQFADLGDLLLALRRDMRAIAYTAELVGLASENGIHKMTVDKHTEEVVRRLRRSTAFAHLPTDADRDIVELAAYLHDIGKGPKSRWEATGGLQKVDPDHPAGAMPMLANLLTQQVADCGGRRVGTLLKLVCYHDLIGDVLGKGRDESQISDVASDIIELDMLFALGRADATSLVEHWWDEDSAAALRARCVRNIVQ
jgi:hypothetical protein